MSILSDSNVPPIESAVIGERNDDPNQLLLLGDNGAYYAYSIQTDTVAQIEPDETWEVEDVDGEVLFT